MEEKRSKGRGGVKTVLSKIASIWEEYSLKM